jgi:predicted aconitase
MGAALASNGAVGLYHVDRLTPEARELKKSLLKKKYKTYVVDDAELERVYRGYPVMWKSPDARPKICFIGCPHLSLAQVRAWLAAIEDTLAKHGRRSAAVRTVLTTAPDVADAFRRESGVPQRLASAGVTLSSICPLMYMNNPFCAKEPVATNSNKLRTYTTARYFKDDDILKIIAKGRTI